MPLTPPVRDSVVVATGNPPLRRRPGWLVPAGLLVAALGGWYLLDRMLVDRRPIVVGILHSETGPMAVSERSMIDAEVLALEQINLASTINDGQRVWFTRKGELPPVGVAGSPSVSGAIVSVGPLDLNSASLEQLDSLSGIGPATAKAIIDRRNEIGRFRSVDDLLSVKGIGPTKLESIRSGVVVR